MSVLTAPNDLATCSYQRAIDGLKAHPGYDANDASAVEQWTKGEVSANQVARELRLAGFRTSATLVKDHRRGECICTVAL